MGKQKVLMISVMKPLDEPRIFEKIGGSLAQRDDLEVHSAGQPATSSHTLPIQQHPIYKFPFRSWRRLWAGPPAWKLLKQLRPDVVIVATHELLWTVALYRALYKCKLVYDLQENYALNMWDSQRNLVLRAMLSPIIRIKEWITSIWMDHIWLAESCYLQEMPWLQFRATLIENKALPQTPKPPSNSFEIIYTGTIGENYGTLEAIALARLLLEHRKGTFTVVGFCPDPAYLKRVQLAMQDHPNMELIGGEFFVSHGQIMERLSECTIAIMSYKNRRSINQKVPTKFYECFQLKIPMIIPENPFWMELCSRQKAAIPVDFSQPDPSKILQTLDSTDFYTPASSENYSWTSEEEKLYISIDNLLI